MTQQTNHTPAPWIIGSDNFGNVIVCKDKLFISHIHPISNDGVSLNAAEAEANARLIAAAPETAAERDRLKEINAELLEALQKIVEIDVDGGISDIARAATASATGGE